LGGKTLVYLGTISYEFYLVHQFVLERVSNVVGKPIIAVIVAFAIALAASVVLYELVQRPLERILRGGWGADGLRIALVGLCAGVLVLFSFPKARLPVESARVTVTAAIAVPGLATFHVRGTEAVDFASPGPSTSARFSVTGGQEQLQVEERVVGGSIFSRAASTTSALSRAVWSSGASASSVAFPGSPNDDPARLVAQLQMLGSTKVVSRPTAGAGGLTKLRIAVSLTRASPDELRGFNISNDPAARTKKLTIWVFVDANHLVRVVQYRDDLDDLGRTAASVTATFKFSDFNDGVARVNTPSNTDSASPGEMLRFVPPLFS
jgi:hypothetical protein